MIAFSPIRQHPEVLELFLKHMAVQPVDLWVYDDNTDPESSLILKRSGIRILPRIAGLPRSAYRRAEDTHKWDVPTYQRVARIKNAAISRFLRARSDALFLIDSDVLLRRGTITHLDTAQVPIIASVYWTKWFPHVGRGPNSWTRTPEPLREPGHHEVTGLGACTLIRREVFNRGIRFIAPSHLAREGEDRWFCYHAIQAGFKLMMCSHMEPFHVYRDSEIGAAVEWSAAML
jgi:hypothetical protein